MPMITTQTSIAAGATATPLSGNQFEFVRDPSLIEFGMCAEATGMVATVFSGADLLMQEGPVNIRAAGTPPTYPDDFVLQDVAGNGDRLSVTYRNTSAGTIIVRTTVRVTPL
ncbi:MAG TPA: hypothetical protein VIU40_02240 [Geobacteraceae bacterium]